MGKLTPMLQQYFAIKEQHKDAVVFFHLGDFYEMFGPDAVEVSRLLDLTLTARQKGTENEMPMCGFPAHAAAPYIAKLTKAGKRIAVCDQLTEPDGKGIVQRAVTRVITPGTTFDETVLDGKIANFLCAVVSRENQFGLAVVDVTTGRFQVGAYESFEPMKDELHRLAPSEILVDGLSDSDRETLSQTAFTSVFAVPAWQEPQDLLSKHFQTVGMESYGLANETLLQRAAANTLVYLQETQRSVLGHIRTIEILRHDSHMMLDESTIRNLELFAVQQTGEVAGSLFHVIDRTSTAMGGRLLRWQLTHPAVSAEEIQSRLQAVNVFFEQEILREDVRTHLSSMCDLERLVGKVGTMRANPRDLFNLKETLSRLPELKQSILSWEKESNRLAELACLIDEHVGLCADIAKTLNDDPPVLTQDGGYIRAGVNAELDELRSLSTTGKEWISRLQETERERTGINSMKIKYNSVFGYYIEISKANLASVPADYIRKQTLVNAERYITPELKEYEEKVLGAQDKIVRLEQTMLTELRERVFAHVQTLQTTARALAAIDVLSALAELAVERRYARPIIVEDGALSIKQGRHPVIETIIEGAYVPNDIALNAENHFVLLTGPNMAGKSSFLRMTALLVLLAQIGSFVPAQEMTWSVVDRLFTRVGASDNLARGRSTFMVEMQEAAYILNNATEKSLVILDELGRGTSTYDGLSLAWAMTEHFHDVVKAKTLFATHYHELIEIVDRLKRGKNFSVAVAEDQGRVVFLHQVLVGGINRSYGIDVAKLAGLPHSIVVRAKDILAKLEQHAWEQKQQTRQGTLPLMPVAKQTEHPVVAKLRGIDPNVLTPMQALQLLQEFKNETEE
jgi:DNA mismatch repair protein MutS